MQQPGATDNPFVTGTDFVTQPVRDYEKAATFYGETLGLEFSKRWGHMPAGEFETGSLTIALMEPDAFGMRSGPSASAIALRVDDVEATRAELESKGVEFKGATIDSGVCLQAIFEDPDGNVLILHHRYEPELTRSERPGSSQVTSG
jgi:predicted enzyme related to lactoylglutathione lyase